MPPFLIIWGILLLLLIPIVILYSRRGVTQWHRPKFGEILLFSIIMVMVTAAVAALVVNVFGLDRISKQMGSNPVDTEEYVPLAPSEEEL